MLFDIGWPELLLIGVVALVVIGPKDLPAALRVAGYWVRKARMLSREFQGSVEQMIRDAELDEMRQQLKKATELDIEKEFQKTVDPTGSLAESIKPPEIPDFFETTPAVQAAEPARIEASTELVPDETPAIGLAEAQAEEAEEPRLPGLDLPPPETAAKPEPPKP
jgi:sec-independent protein translocase protein TatB